MSSSQDDTSHFRTESDQQSLSMFLSGLKTTFRLFCLTSIIILCLQASNVRKWSSDQLRFSKLVLQMCFLCFLEGGLYICFLTHYIRCFIVVFGRSVSKILTYYQFPCVYVLSETIKIVMDLCCQIAKQKVYNIYITNYNILQSPRKKLLKHQSLKKIKSHKPSEYSLESQ